MPGAEHRVALAAAVDAGIRADLHRVAEHHAAELRHGLEARHPGVGAKPKPSWPTRAPGCSTTPRPAMAVADAGMGADAAALAQHHPVADHGVRAEDAAGADLAPRRRSPRTGRPRSPRAERRVGVHHRRRMDARHRRRRADGTARRCGRSRDRAAGGDDRQRTPAGSLRRPGPAPAPRRRRVSRASGGQVAPVVEEADLARARPSCSGRDAGEAAVRRRRRATAPPATRGCLGQAHAGPAGRRSADRPPSRAASRGQRARRGAGAARAAGPAAAAACRGGGGRRGACAGIALGRDVHAAQHAVDLRPRPPRSGRRPASLKMTSGRGSTMFTLAAAPPPGG